MGKCLGCLIVGALVGAALTVAAAAVLLAGNKLSIRSGAASNASSIANV